jgi:hypothetical protein
MRASGGVDDAMATAERLTVGDSLQNRGDLWAVVGVCVAEQQFGCRGYSAWLVAMQAFNVFRPFPTLTVDVEAEPAYPLPFFGAHCKVGRIAIPVEVCERRFARPGCAVPRCQRGRLDPIDVRGAVARM